MADDKDELKTEVVEDEEVEEVDYKPPPEKSLKEIVEADLGDESLRKYKEALLGEATKEAIILEPDNPNRVLVKKLALVVEGRPDLILDLSGEHQSLKQYVGNHFQLMGWNTLLNMLQKFEVEISILNTTLMEIPSFSVEKIAQMVGSYAPKPEIQSFMTQQEEMPSGMLARGKYTVRSLFTDDDKNEHLKWEWTFELKKDWD
ncbi:rho GDP-dissociation inhibitor 2-like [Limulus polyphemus]|uniref:Rho GDP-dissociation inhibitor 2-like n=1 Tax=Limulus polyphemus TaxID=6850 RepID=A0ABM1SE82_LIMPO|nr:rho GDP-dissociation inhibitor 2-like [Limulus polyphemus]